MQLSKSICTRWWRTHSSVTKPSPLSKFMPAPRMLALFGNKYARHMTNPSPHQWMRMPFLPMLLVSNFTSAIGISPKASWLHTARPKWTSSTRCALSPEFLTSSLFRCHRTLLVALLILQMSWICIVNWERQQVIPSRSILMSMLPSCPTSPSVWQRTCACGS